MQFDDLNESNVLLYAAKCYDKPNCIQSEFDEDYKKFRYIKRLLNRYRLTGKIKERLLLNHINLTQNVFGVEASTRILHSVENIAQGRRSIQISLDDFPDDAVITNITNL